MTQRQVVVSAVLACVCGAALSYADQGQRPGSAPRPRPTVGTNRDSKDTEGESHTLTGCVLAGTAPKTYIVAETLSLLTPEGAAPRPVTVRDGGTRYQLLTDGTIDLSKLVNREVSVTGNVSVPAVSSDTQKSTTRPEALSTLTVKSLKATGASCSLPRG
ncbi:MAG TPA: hypothetical protein VFO31_06820 [Vicinamibacterales bacterium]|nr:hypothetical protein [Vicinamibacterales bacterium]